MNKKVGLMTWFGGNNYGTILQATSLRYVITKLKNECEIINYKKRANIREIKRISSLFFRVKNKILFNKIDNRASFDEFRMNFLKFTDERNTYVELKELNNSFDSFICGSDQIWSPLTFDEKYFLDFADNNKLISYAPSFGFNKIESQIISRKMKELLLRFKYLSVRESTGKKIINNLTGLNAKIVLDPTLLLDKNEWEYFENKDILNEIKNKYILCYFLGKSNKYCKAIKKFANQNNLKIINIPVYRMKKLNKYNINNIGPSEFISLLKNAEYVFTDSFHGTIFSINFNKKFYTFKRFKDNDRKSENSRIINILEEFNLSNRLVLNNRIIDNEIDYNSVNKILIDKRKDSINFLSNAIDNVNYIEKDDNHKITDLCSGCGACKSVCPKEAITIEQDDEGFEKYSIDKTKCINCKLCENVCPMRNLSTKKVKEGLGLYSFKAKEEEILQKSSSGGFSYLLSYLYNDKYYICGSYYDKNSKIAKHIIIKPNRKEELSKIQGSKYIQSKSADTFMELMNLPKGSKAIFFGTPCQVAGLDKLLKVKKIRDNFILVDLICHGIPSAFLWNNYLSSKISKYNLNEKEVKIEFRDKKLGWHKKYISIHDDDKKVSFKENIDEFYNFFSRNYIYNKSCYECPYRENSSADIRIGDFWGEKFQKDKSGVSMVICMTEKGNNLIKELKKNNDMKAIINEETMDDYFKYQDISNRNEPFYREELIKKIKNNEDLKKLMRKYCKYDRFVERLVPIYRRIRK